MPKQQQKNCVHSCSCRETVSRCGSQFPRGPERVVALCLCVPGQCGAVSSRILLIFEDCCLHPVSKALSWLRWPQLWPSTSVAAAGAGAWQCPWVIPSLGYHCPVESGTKLCSFWPGGPLSESLYLLESLQSSGKSWWAEGRCPRSTG